MKKHTRSNGVFVEYNKTLKVTTHFRLTDLPLGVLHDILFRLPIISILNLKFVFRDFNKIISHPEFVTNYSKFAPFVTFLLPKNLTGSPSIYQDLELLQFSDKDYKCFRTTLKPKIPGLSDGSSGFHHICTLNGLFILVACKSQTETIYICNPITGEYKALPERPTEIYDYFRARYRFGYCGSVSSYKILRIASRCTEPWLLKAEILTIGIDDSWRPLDYPMYNIPWLSKLINVNGVFHWIGKDTNGYSCIDTFDLGEEKIGQIPHPHGLKLELDYIQMASINNAHLAVTDHSISGRIVLWEMREYGVEESWTKLMVLDVLSIRDIGRFGLFPELIFQNGELFYSCNYLGYLVTHNPITGENIKIYEHCYDRVTFTPSFLSLEEALMGGH